ncbi:hypothetical protein BT96DRAFT_1092373 [Gymnopus androsaceus JB14]|uniref:FAR1 domain-containing protein n=1 Tax=Gymnopus androsaceus JB14 TaxID=1447944 RepID=A0A6A4GI56_9AGAR|nr:hypothetical protein BT96DRAFT_949987 [Gymnopus androsaceus JB14]KAE9385226.1 hypothetical protein BT96DRAFT_1092373 [Gymnopus androsaceus JB14]
MQFKFRLDPSVTSPAIPENPVNFCPDSSFNSFRVAPVPPSVSYGSFEYDSCQPKYNLRWNTWEEFSKWLEHEEISKAIELRRVGEKTGKDKYASRFLYVCSRHGTGGVKPYMLKNPHWIRKIASKRSNCQCFLKVKTYHNTSVVLANYTNAHNHPVGNANLPYTIYLLWEKVTGNQIIYIQ